MEESVLLKIEEYIDSDIELPLVKRELIGKTINYKEGIDLYVNHLTKLGPDLSKLNIALDLANGSASRVAEQVFNNLRANITVINNTPNGVNINNNCGSTHIEGLAELVKKGKYDCGFAYDGDADRCLMVDNKGNILSGDHILYIYANYLKSKNELKNNTVVTTVMSNFGLYLALDKENISYAKTKVGDKYVYEYMKEHDCSIGGEQSGHIIFIDNASTGDGILTSLKMLEVIKNTNKSLSDLVKNIVIYPQVLLNIKVSNKKQVQEDNDVINSINEVEKELGNEGRILVRESGTEPLIRVMVEAKSKDLCNSLASRVIDVIKNKGYEVK